MAWVQGGSQRSKKEHNPAETAGLGQAPARDGSRNPETLRLDRSDLRGYNRADFSGGNRD